MKLFDTADVYSDGARNRCWARRSRAGANDGADLDQDRPAHRRWPAGLGRVAGRLISAVEAALRRLGTDHIDLLQLHAFDASTPVEELMGTLDRLIADSGKVRYAGVSNYPGWQLMKAQAVAERRRPAALRRPSGLLFADRPRL